MKIAPLGLPCSAILMMRFQRLLANTRFVKMMRVNYGDE
jgi:hypothetical protein